MTYAKNIMLYERAFSCAGLLDTTSTQPAVRLTQLRQCDLCSDGSHYEKRGKGEPVCIDDEIPFEIPESWEWVRLESLITDTKAGKSPQCKDRPRNANEWGVIKTTAIQDGYFIADENKVLPKGFVVQESQVVAQDDLLITRAGPRNRTGVLCVVDQHADRLILSDKTVRLAYMRGYVEPHYLMHSLSSPLIQQSVIGSMSGMAASQVNISQAKMKEWLIPLPPLNEQERICRLMNTIAPLVNDYGSLEATRERLDAELPDRLRKSILQLAVQGKLVDQDPTDEPASALLARIRAERTALVKAKKIRAPKGGECVIYRASDGGYYEKRGKGESVCIDDEIPFDIPESWEWVRLESATVYIQRGKSPKYSPIKKYPVVAQKCNQWSGFSLELAKYCGTRYWTGKSRLEVSPFP